MASKAGDGVTCALSSMAAQDWTLNSCHMQSQTSLFMFQKQKESTWLLRAVSITIYNTVRTEERTSLLFAKSAVETNVGSQNFGSKQDVKKEQALLYIL